MRIEGEKRPKKLAKKAYAPPAPLGSYTAIVQGINSDTGVGIAEVYDLDSTSGSLLPNISTRGLAQTGDNVMIRGFIVVTQPTRHFECGWQGSSRTLDTSPPEADRASAALHVVRVLGDQPDRGRERGGGSERRDASHLCEATTWQAGVGAPFGVRLKVHGRL